MEHARLLRENQRDHHKPRLQQRVRQYVRHSIPSVTIYSQRDAMVCTGVVTTDDGIEIDFVRAPLGIAPDQILRYSIALESVRVMHPVHVMASRAANVVQIPRTDEHALAQLRASVYVVREFIRQELIVAGEIASARKVNEQAFKVVKSNDGLHVWAQHHVDLFDAVVTDMRLGEKFLTERYRRMQSEIARLRST
jgi:hypothetical protein